MLLQVLSEELKHQVEFLLSMDHIQQSGREGSVSGCGTQDPNPHPLTSFPSSLDNIGVLQFFEQGDLSDGGAGNPLSLPVGKDEIPSSHFWPGHVCVFVCAHTPLCACVCTCV